MSKKKWTFNSKLFLIFLILAALIAWGLSRVIHLNFWESLGIVLVSSLLNGWIATAEDKAPGGFNNPNGKMTKGMWRTRWVLLGILILLLAVCFLPAMIP